MIPKEFIENVLRKTDLEALISNYVDLSANGAQLRGVCPFCHHSKPTFNISVDKGIYKCFSCGKGGNAIKFVEEIEQLAFPEAVGFLAKRLDL